MSAPRHRAWRFAHPDHTGDPAFAGLALSNAGGVAMVEEDESIRQAILLLLSTSPGERVMRPDYGCEIRRLAFLPNDETTAGLADHYVHQALVRWEPRIDLLAVDATAAREAPDRLDIHIEYRVRASARIDRLVFPLQLGGGPS